MIRKRGILSNIIRVFIQDNSITTGKGKTGLAYDSTNLQITVIRELSATPTIYTGANIETITTIGTFQAPSTSAKCRFKAIDATNRPGEYEIHFHDDAGHFGAGDTSKNVQIRVDEITTTALNIAPCLREIELVAYDPQDATALGLGLALETGGKLDDILEDTGTTLPATVALKEHLVNGSGNITPPTNKGIWDVLGDGTVSISGLVSAIWDAATSGMSTVGSIGKKLADWVVGTIDTYTGNTKQTADVKTVTDIISDSKIAAQVKGQDNIDFGALQKASLNAATPAVTVSDKTGFALTGAYDAAKTAASQSSVNDIDTSIGSAARFTEIKGSGWTDETLKAIKEAAGSGGISAQQVRDAMKLAPTTGDPASGSVDKHLDEIQAKTDLYLLGTGTNTIVITVYEYGTTTPIAGYNVAFYNSDLSIYYGTLQTNSLGQITTNINDGTYKLKGQKVGYTPDNVTETFTVDATHLTKTIYATAIAIGLPSATNSCRVYEYCFLADDITPKTSVTATAVIESLPYDYNGKLHAGDQITAVYSAITGKIYWDVVWGASVKFKITGIFPAKTFVIPSVATKRLSEMT